MDNRSYKVALGGVISSLCLLAMFMAGVAPFLYLTLPMIAGALISIIVVEVNSSWALLTYIAVSLLSVYVTYDKESALIFILFFGHYPIIKQKIEKIRIRPLKSAVKIIVFNICIVLYYQLALTLLGIQDMTDDFAAFGKYGIYILWGLSNIIFVVYDYALGGCIDMYIKYLKPKIFRNKRN